MNNFLDDHEMLKWAGLNFGEREAYLMWMSIKRHAAISSCENLRFAGKIYGTNLDYWVIYGRKPSAHVQAREVEPRGTGVNYYVYYVTDHLQHDWI